jgi:uncharacterized membrane protein
MMDAGHLLRWLHVIGACVLLGTGAGIAFFMVAARRSRDIAVIAGVAQIVVLADFLFTATAVIIQPVTGLVPAHVIGWPLSEGWIVLSLARYVFTGLFWLPVVWLQIRLRDMAVAARRQGLPLPARYHRYYRLWFALGFPAFAAVLAILWLMTARPSLALW